MSSKCLKINWLWMIGPCKILTMRQSTWSLHLCEVMHPRILCNSSEGSWDCGRWHILHCLCYSKMCPHIYKSHTQTEGPENSEKILICCHLLLQFLIDFQNYIAKISNIRMQCEVWRWVPAGKHKHCASLQSCSVPTDESMTSEDLVQLLHDPALIKCINILKNNHLLMIVSI